MRSITLFGAAAVVLLAVAPAQAEDILFVSGTGDPVVAVAPLPFADAPADSDDAQADLMKMSDRLADPRMQDGVADMVGSMSEKLMDFPIGKFAVAMERAIPGGMKGSRGKRIREGDTVADLAGRDADRLPDQLADGSRQMMGMMSGFAAAFAGMIPEFEELARDLEDSIDDVKTASRHQK